MRALHGHRLYRPGRHAGNERAIAEFVRRLRPGPRSGILALRALAVSLGPDVIERVDDGRVTYLRRERPFLVVDAQRQRLLATFPTEIPLDDPMGRLLKRGEERYFRLDGPDDLDGHAQEFVRDAYAAARA